MIYLATLDKHCTSLLKCLCDPFRALKCVSLLNRAGHMSAKQLPVFPVRLNVPMEHTHLAKGAGAKWNQKLKAWTATNPAALYKCRQWAHAMDCLGLLWSKEWLDVPHNDNDRAKVLGARYDPKYCCWYVPVGLASGSAKLDEWRMRHHVAQQHRIAGII
jgi:hypothetical protein